MKQPNQKQEQQAKNKEPYTNLSEQEMKDIRQQISLQNIAASAKSLAPLTSHQQRGLDLLTRKLRGEFEGEIGSEKLKAFVSLNSEREKSEESRSANTLNQTNVASAKAKCPNINKVYHLLYTYISYLFTPIPHIYIYINIQYVLYTCYSINEIYIYIYIYIYILYNYLTKFNIGIFKMTKK